MLPVLASVFNLGHSNRCVVDLIVALFCVSLITNAIEQVLVCHLYIFLGKCLFKHFAHF